jgi:GGDEF domain-containing protein
MSADRDARSDARDRRADAREQDQPRLDPNVVLDRIGARRDRQNSANDRIHAAHDRRAAAEDRDLAARERSSLVVCELTGAALRGPGLAELEREIVKAERTGQPFVVAFIDVDGLKAVNDAHGHSAGDEVLESVVDTIRGTVRD